jgi:tetratricopeptide (TPR) repeat protein
MVNEYSRSDYSAHLHRQHILQAALLVVVIVVIIVLLSLFFINWRSRLGNKRADLLQLWETGVYDKAFALSGELLEDKPMDYFLLMVHGFSSYQLGIAQINSLDTQSYIDAAIWSLRKALLVGDTADGRLQYVLGKAYHSKGFGYADLAVKYLEEAKAAACDANDIPEYLGLSYALLRDYRSSVAAFSLALNPAGVMGGVSNAEQPPPDLLLLSIAHSYIELGELSTARAYLIHCVDTSRDSKKVVTARLLLGDILRKSGEVQEAETQYLTILSEDGENAEAHFQLGELYAGAGDTTRARAEWRKAFRLDPAHRPARERLNL